MERNRHLEKEEMCNEKEERNRVAPTLWLVSMILFEFAHYTQKSGQADDSTEGLKLVRLVFFLLISFDISSFIKTFLFLSLSLVSFISLFMYDK